MNEVRCINNNPDGVPNTEKRSATPPPSPAQPQRSLLVLSLAVILPCLSLVPLPPASSLGFRMCIFPFCFPEASFQFLIFFFDLRGYTAGCPWSPICCLPWHEYLVQSVSKFHSFLLQFMLTFSEQVSNCASEFHVPPCSSLTFPAHSTILIVVDDPSSYGHLNSRPCFHTALHLIIFIKILVNAEGSDFRYTICGTHSNTHTHSHTYILALTHTQSYTSHTHLQSHIHMLTPIHILSLSSHTHIHAYTHMRICMHANMHGHTPPLVLLFSVTSLPL